MKVDKPASENEKIEIRLLLQAVYEKYGYDFRDYQKASIKRRIMRRQSLSNVETISEMQHKLLYDKEFFETLLLDFSINVTEIFRDPSFYRTLREKVIPLLTDRPFLKIWHAGCATGEEVYSMAILLKEEGIFKKTRIYATDINQKVLETAREGIYPIAGLKQGTRNYKKAGGLESFTDYYTARYDRVLMDKSLRENIVFSDHNLATDSSFGEMDVVICRNVLIYFNRELQNRVFRLFRDSLVNGGFLCLGSKETVRICDCSGNFEDFAADEKIYRKESDQCSVISDQVTCRTK